MYKVVEFADNGDGAGGVISVVRLEWLTPRKHHCLWPPHRIMSRFNKCLIEGAMPDDTWEIYSIKRIFYETDSLTKAREKAKQAEIDSEVGSDYNQIPVGRRKKTRKIYDSDTDTSEGKSDDTAITYPTPPATQIGSILATNITTHEDCEIDYTLEQPLTESQNIAQGTSIIDVECGSNKNRKQVATTKNTSKPGTSTGKEQGYDKYKKQVTRIQITSTPGTSTDEECSVDKCLLPKTRVQCSTDKDSNKESPSPVQNAEVGLSSTLGSLDLTLTPFLKDLAPNSQALDVIAKHLARIETEIKELQVSQNEILHRLRSSSTTNLELPLPDDLKLPCDDRKDLEGLESWVTIDENRKLMTTYLSFVGGNKIPVIIRRVLEKIFTNKLALSCNWTGKNAKTPLKDLQIIKIIRDAVRANKIAEKVTDSEIHEVIANWFRFTKDRNGGREARRIRQ